MDKRPDNSEKWIKDQELYDRDYKAGYGAYLDNDPDAHSDAPGWKQGYKEAENELKRPST